MSETAAAYEARCHQCRASFDALTADWCTCIATERTLVCPRCGSCFCKAPLAYKRSFWTGAPKALWDRKFSEHHGGPVPRPNPDPADVERPLVLLVDDERDIQRVASQTIESLGYGLVLAKNGAEGLELARKYRPDLVLTDALMPKMDGREMCRQIKSDPGLASTKVVIMTALFTNLKYEIDAYKNYKVDAYLKKPLDVSELRSLLQKHAPCGPSSTP